MRNEILTEDHRFWDALRYRLNDGLRVYGCDCSIKLTERILMSLPNIDVEESLNYLEAYGGFCDYKIIDAINKIHTTND